MRRELGRHALALEHAQDLERSFSPATCGGTRAMSAAELSSSVLARYLVSATGAIMSMVVVSMLSITTGKSARADAGRLEQLLQQHGALPQSGHLGKLG